MISIEWLWHNWTLNQNDKYDYGIIKVLNQNESMEWLWNDNMRWIYWKGQYLMGLKINAIERLL